MPVQLDIEEIINKVHSHKNRNLMRFDQDKFNKYLNSIDLSKIQSIHGGLEGDWNYNSCLLWKDSKTYEYDVHPYSTWAKPSILVIYKDGSEELIDMYS